MSDSQDRLAATACVRCREQKLRCSREQPACARCTRLSAECSYPPPPNRKLLATLRATPKKRKTDQDVSKAPAKKSITGHVEEPSPAVTLASSESNTISGTTIPESELFDIDHVVHRILIDVYFDCAFNSSLIFHRPTFERSLAQGSVPSHTLAAIYAMATVFLVPSSARMAADGTRLGTLGKLEPRARRWAIYAGKQALQNIDSPDAASIQTCQVLSLYWFACGDGQRNTMFCGITQRAARIRWREIKSLRTAMPVDDLQALPAWSEDEAARRSFWAAWFTNTINSDHYVVGSSGDRFALRLQLPMSETAYEQGTQEVTDTLSDCTNSHDHHANHNALSEPSIMGELIRINHMWARVRDHIDTQDSQAARMYLADLLALDEKLTRWASNLPADFAYSKRSLYLQLVVKQQPAYTLLFALYYQCRLILHSSLVPHFSGVASQEGMPVEAVRISAHIALKNAFAISDLGADMMALEWDYAKVAPFVGYCMYVSATIQIALVHSSEETLRSSARKGLISCLTVLKSMKVYWKNLQQLWTRIHLMYETQLRKLAAPGNDATSPVGVRAYAGDLDQVVTTKRDWGQQTEPLADSVLVYTLQNLHQDVRTDDTSPRSREIESLTRLDQIAELMRSEENGCTKRTPTATTSPTFIVAEEQPALPCAAAVSTQSTFFPYDVPTTMNDFDDSWWQFDPSIFPQGVLPYEDLFGATGAI